MRWPELRPSRARALELKALEAAGELEDVAARITIHAGGGAPAHQAREAARLAREAAELIRELGGHPNAPDLVRARHAAQGRT